MRVNIEREEKVNIELHSARLQSGKTQAQVAKEANIAERTYQYYESGRKSPGVRTAIRIAKALNSTTEKLWGEGTAIPEKTTPTE